MSILALMRWCGLAALVGGVLFVLADFLGLTLGSDFAQAAATGSFLVQQLLFLLGAVLVLFGLFGLYLSQSEAAGALGVAGFLLAFLGTALVAGVSWAQAFIAPFVAREAPELLAVANFAFPLTFLIFALGWVLFGVATLRASIYPRAAAIVLIIGAVLPFVGFLLPVSAFVFGIGVAWLGFVLFAQRSAAEVLPPRA